VLRRYLGEVGKFYGTLWLIYPRHCTSIYQFLSKSVKYCRSYDKKIWCVFYASQCSICGVLLQRGVCGTTDSTSKHVDYSASLNSLPLELPCQRDVIPTTSAVTSSASGSSVGRSASLPNVVVSEDYRERRDVTNVNPPLRFYSGSLRHKDSILLRKSKLKQVQLRPSGQRLSAEALKNDDIVVEVIDAPSDSSNGNDFHNRSKLSPRPWLSSNPGVSKLGQGHRGAIAPWTAGTWLPEFGERSYREPTSSRQLSRRQCGGNNEAIFHRNSSNKLTVILSAVDLPSYASRSPFYCECQATLAVRCLPNSGRRCRGSVAATQYLVGSQPGSDDLRKYPSRTCSRNSEPSKGKLQYEDGLTSSSPSPEPFTCQKNTSAGNDSPLTGNRSPLSGAPVTLTSQRRVYTLARAYSDRVKKLQRRSNASHPADDFDINADLRVQVHRARARSASVGRRTAFPLSPALVYK